MFFNIEIRYTALSQNTVLTLRIGTEMSEQTV